MPKEVARRFRTKPNCSLNRMNRLPVSTSPSSDWIFLAECLFFGSTALSVCVVAFAKLDRWLVSVRGLPGIALIEHAELIQTLPRRVWELKVEVFPEDIPNLNVKRTVRWAESEFKPSMPQLQPSTRLQIRFRRSPRPLIMPRKDIRWSRRRNASGT
jgi:hypothetical protein